MNLMQKKVTIYCGVPGAGKSTLVAKNHDKGSLVCSGDHFFTDEDGVYRFDHALLPKAHAACLKKYVEAVSCWPITPTSDIVVDNTNTTVAEIAPYAALALAYAWDLDIVHVRCDLQVAVDRNAARVEGKRVPEKSIAAMHERISETFGTVLGYKASGLPPWWPRREVTT